MASPRRSGVELIGTPVGAKVIVDYDPRWSAQYEAEATRLRAVVDQARAVPAAEGSDA